MPKFVTVSISPGSSGDAFTVTDNLGNTLDTNVSRTSLESGVTYVVDTLVTSISVTSTYICTNTEVGVIGAPPPSLTPTPTPTKSNVIAVSPSPTVTVTPSITVSKTPSITATPSVTPSITVSKTPSITPTVTPSISVSVTPSISISPTPTVTPSTSMYTVTRTLSAGSYPVTTGAASAAGTITNINPTQVYIYLIVNSGGNTSGDISLDSVTITGAPVTQMFPNPTTITAGGQTIYSSTYYPLAPGETANWSIIKNDGLTFNQVKMGWSNSPGGTITVIN